MKLDKETLIKHRFWVLLTAVVPLVIIAIFILLTIVSASIADYRKQLEDAHKAAQGPFPNPVNPRFIEEKKKLADALEEEETKVWVRVYEEQKPITSGEAAWPKAFNTTYRFHDGLFAKRIQHFAAGKPLPPANPESKDTFQGQVEQEDQDYILVSGTEGDAKTPVQKQFFKSARMKVTDDTGKDLGFNRINKGDSVVVTYQVSKYFNDPLTTTERAKFAIHYREPIPNIIEQVEPLDSKGQGVVQFKNWIYQKGELPPPGSKFFHYVDRDWDLAKDFSEEAWIAQENMWLQREIYRLVRLANDYVSKFTHEGGDGRNSPYVCYNAYWRLELKLVDGKLQTKVSNLTPQRQPLDVWLWINFSNKDVDVEAKTVTPAEWADFRNAKFEKVHIQGEPLYPKGHDGASRDATFDLDPETVQRVGIFNVEQQLTWKTAAVKRIDEIAIAEHSHRTIVKGLKPLKEPKPVPGAVDPNLDQPAPFQGQVQQREKIGEHGLKFNRYSEVTPQARRVPLAVSLIVDQQHVNRVLAAFANSNLRLVMTQVMQNHTPEAVAPRIADPASKRQPAFGFGEQPNFGGLFPGQPANEEQEANIELVIYGIVSLYERHPPRPPETEEIQQIVPPQPQP